MLFVLERDNDMRFVLERDPESLAGEPLGVLPDTLYVLEGKIDGLEREPPDVLPLEP